MNRLIRWNVEENRIEWECDPRHSQITMEQLGLKEDNKGVSTPGVSLDPDPNSAPLNARERTAFRRVTMRTAYQAIDRPELLFASKEAARSMQNPTLHDMNKLKRIRIFLITTPKTVQYFRRQGIFKLLTQYTDTDHAASKTTRRSTSASITLHGNHCLHALDDTEAYSGFER